MTDYIVKDISLADFGRKELDIAETEMPGPMALREGIMMEITHNVEDYIIKFEKYGYQLIFNSGSKTHNDLGIRDGNLFFVKSNEHSQALRIN